MLACFQAPIDLETDGGDLRLASNGAALLPPGRRRSNGSHSLASIRLAPEAVATAASAMAGLPPLSAKLLAKASGFPPISLAGEQAELVHSLLHTIDTSLAMGPSVSAHLGLDDVLHRTAAMLLHPALLSEEPADLLRYRDPAGRRSFDELLDYILANLDQPLRLSDLESRSHYSKRSLQYAFRNLLNTTPKQWIREQRMARALELLQGDGVRPTVQAVALICGYANISHFSRDFKTRFGLSPSEARRN